MKTSSGRQSLSRRRQYPYNTDRIHRPFSLVPVMTLYGPQAALIAESFAPRLRYSGAGLGYQLASIIAGGPAPFIAAALFAAFHSGYAIALYILACGLISIGAVWFLKDYTGKDVSQDYDGV